MACSIFRQTRSVFIAKPFCRWGALWSWNAPCLDWIPATCCNVKWPGRPCALKNRTIQRRKDAESNSNLNDMSTPFWPWWLCSFLATLQPSSSFRKERILRHNIADGLLRQLVADRNRPGWTLGELGKLYFWQRNKFNLCEAIAKTMIENCGST